MNRVIGLLIAALCLHSAKTIQTSLKQGLQASTVSELGSIAMAQAKSERFCGFGAWRKTELKEKILKQTLESVYKHFEEGVKGGKMKGRTLVYYATQATYPPITVLVYEKMIKRGKRKTKRFECLKLARHSNENVEILKIGAGHSRHQALRRC